MTGIEGVPELPQGAAPRRRFAAKYRHRGWGIGLAIFGGLGTIGGLGALVNPTEGESSPAGGLVVSLACIALAVYLLRGSTVNPKIAERRAVAEQRRAAVAHQGMEQATAALAAATGGAALVAYRNLEATAQRFYRGESSAKVAEALASIAFDMGRLQSPRYGIVPTLAGGHIEIFRDWVIDGQAAHDVEPSTRAAVHTDGSVQVTSAVVTDKKNRSRIVNQEHDMRTAQLQFTSASWVLSAAIDPTAVNEARMVIAQLESHIDTIKPQAATSADIRDMVNAILNSTGQPPAEKLRQLSNLRYERLLSDEQFERAKNVILGI